MSKKRKLDYELAFVEVTNFDDQDVITTSTPTYELSPGDGLNDNMWDT